MLQNITDIYATPQYIAWHSRNTQGVGLGVGEHAHSPHLVGGRRINRGTSWVL